MKLRQQQMIAAYVKEARLAKGYTQKELSNLSNISVRSIQRIENGEILPRSYTLKTLSEILGIPLVEAFQQQQLTQRETIQPGELAQKSVFKINNIQRIMLSIGLPLLILFGCWAYIAQSPSFPETLFELLTLITIVLLLVTIFLFMIWRTK